MENFEKSKSEKTGFFQNIWVKVKFFRDCFSHLIDKKW